MVELRPEWENPKRVKQFLKHFVPIHLRLEKDRQEVHQFYSAMLFSVDSRWMLFTAGHCIRCVAKARADDYKLTHGRLLDGLGTDALSPGPIPFDWDAAEPHTLSEDETWDYGVLFPPFNTCQLLEANRVVPFSEPFWAAPPPPDEIIEYQLVGLPEQGTIQTGPENFRFNLMMMRVIPEPQRPEGFAETDAPMFYCQRRSNSGPPCTVIAEVKVTHLCNPFCLSLPRRAYPGGGHTPAAYPAAEAFTCPAFLRSFNR